MRVGRIIIAPNGERRTLDPLVDAAHDDMAGPYGDGRGPYGEPLPTFRDLDEQGNSILFPAEPDPEPEGEE